MLIMCGMFALALVYNSCETGQRIANAFDGIDFTIDLYAWYLFPDDIQRMLPMIIANSQQPITLECFGSIACARQVFKSVCI